MKVALVFGTRPEAIKLFPVIHALQARDDVETRVIVTAQHRGLLDQVLEIAGIVPDIDLDVMTPNQTLDSLTAKLIVELGKAFDAEKPDRVVVHGDTLTTMVASLAAYYRKIPVAHVEAGRRSGDIHHPWPEEVNRRVVATGDDLRQGSRKAFSLRGAVLSLRHFHGVHAKQSRELIVFGLLSEFDSLSGTVEGCVRGSSIEIRHPLGFPRMQGRLFGQRLLRLLRIAVKGGLGCTPARQSLGDEILDFYEPDEDLRIEDLIPDLVVPTPDQEFEADELASCVDRALAEMPREWRLALLLRYARGYEGPRLAHALRRSEDATRGIVEHAEALLRQRLQDGGCTFRR